MKTNATFKLLSGVLVALVSAFILGAAVAPAAQAKSSCGSVNKSPQEIRGKQAKKSVLCLVNAERKSHGLGKLRRDGRLERAAKGHNRVMVRKNCFSHQCGGEKDLAGRLSSSGYLGGKLRRWAYGENIAWGTGDLGTPRKIVSAWMHSPPHRAAILSRSYKEAGIGFHSKVPSKSGASGGTYTIDFGLRQK